MYWKKCSIKSLVNFYFGNININYLLYLSSFVDSVIALSVLLRRFLTTFPPEGVKDIVFFVATLEIFC